MKFLQVKYREKQTDWFGKRGLNWHISSCIFIRDSEKFDIISYAHLFVSCTQDWYSVVSILENLLNEIKRENPQITKAYLRSDEAGCYHNNFLVALSMILAAEMELQSKDMIFRSHSMAKTCVIELSVP